MGNVIGPFSGEYSWLSNFHMAPLNVFHREFPSVEHAFQWAKEPTDEFYAKIIACKTPSKAKAIGRKANLSPTWDNDKLRFMLQCVRAKFFDNPDLASKLIATGNAMLVEINTWNDTYWGVCNNKGENHLGIILMRVRLGVALGK